MMWHRSWLRNFQLASALFGIAVLASPVARAATILLVNNDAAGQGFNDPTPATPVGGNTGTTIGAQRQIAFQRAADIWAARLRSSVPIRARAQWGPLTCTETSAQGGRAGITAVYRDFAGAPIANTLYPVALANALHGSDLNPGDDDMNLTFNISIGTPGCVPLFSSYYGFDGTPPANGFDFVTTALHELGHGLGFGGFVDLATGAKLLGYNDIYMLYLENHGAGPPDYPSMTDAQRVAASTSTGNLHWTGANVRAASGLLSAGAVGDHVRIYAPNPQEPGSSVQHFDTVLTPDHIMEARGNGPHHQLLLELALFKDIGWTVPVSTHDFNGEARSGIAWRQSSTGAVALWLLNGATVSQSGGIGSVPANWQIHGQRDFNGDGRHDLLWRDTTSGATAIWFLNGLTVSSSAALGTVPTSWSVVGTGDFNADSFADLLWRDTSGNTAIWLLNGSKVVQTASIGQVAAPWTVAGVADFNGDSKSDILWRNTSTGETAIWFLDGLTVSSSAGIGAVSTAWTIVATGDFNGDGKADIVWRDSAGNTAIWLMNGAVASSTAGLGTIPAPWTIVETGDFNGDGKADILWRNTTTGVAAIWFMNGTAVSSTASAGSVPTDWTIQNVNVN